MSPQIDFAFLQRVSKIMRDVSALAVMPRFRSLSADAIREKSPGNLVTDADIEAEQLLNNALTALLPGSLVVGEEAVSANPEIMNVLADGNHSIWIVDPVDGTRNFAEGKPLFAMIIALMQGGQVVAGWLYYPTDGLCLMGGQQTGLYREEENGCTHIAPLAAGEGPEMGPHLHVLISPFGQKSADKKLILKEMSFFTRQTGYGCAAQEYRLLLEHNADLGFYSSIWPWDHAAGSFLLRLQGGCVLDDSGQIYQPRPVRPAWLAMGRTDHIARAFHDFSRNMMAQL